MMKQKILLFIAAFVVCCISRAQNISVADFSLAEHDATAMTEGTKVIDQNGEKCALIKIETSVDGFLFDVGNLGIKKVERHGGEIWLYVPHGIRKMTISHQQLGVLRDWSIPVSVNAGRTYVMKLTTGKVTTVVEDAITQQYVVFKLSPANAMVELGGQLLTTEDGVASKLMKFGTYDYRVFAPDCFQEVGKVTVDSPTDKKIINVTLRSNLSTLSVNVPDGKSEIWVNNERKGIGAWQGNVPFGEYRIEARLKGHRTSAVSASLNEGEEKSVTIPSPTPIYGSVNISSSPSMADVYIGKTKVGETPLLIPKHLVGTYKITVKRDGYANAIDSFTVSEGKTADISLMLNKTESPNLTLTSQEPRTFTIQGVSFTMMPVKAGTFTMGDSDEKPVHQVTLTKDYYIGQTEVTQELWQAVMGSNPSYFSGSKHPVEKVSWNDCQTFISKLNSLTGKTFRLPTEAEWEFAARGGNDSKGYQYSGSNNIEDVAWYSVNCYDKGSSSPDYGTHDVATKQPNELGIYDMSGNVYEWCQDWYGSYSSSSQTDPTGANSGSDRVGRGGSWSFSAWRCRSAGRLRDTPDFTYGYLGFRLVLSEL